MADPTTDPRAELYTNAIDSDVTDLAVGWLIKAQLICNVTEDDVDAAKSVIHEPAGADVAQREYASLSDDERAALLELVGKQWSALVSIAVKRLWHAASILGINPESLCPHHVALVAADLISRDAAPIFTDAGYGIASGGGGAMNDPITRIDLAVCAVASILGTVIGGVLVLLLF